MSEQTRVLHVLGGLSLGGAESRIMDLYRKMDRSKIQFDFLVHSSDYPARRPEFYDEEVKHLGGRIFTLPKFRFYNYRQYKKAVDAFFVQNRNYAVVQGHMTSTATIYLQSARQAGIMATAAHARSAGVDPGIKGQLTRLLRLPLLKKADYCFACSAEAGKAVYGKKWECSPKAQIIPNAIDAQKYRFDQKIRSEVRRQLNAEGHFVIGHVGRFHYAKNHEYLIEIFSRLNQIFETGKPSPILLLAGDGDGKASIEEKVKELGLKDRVIFLGNKQDINRYYQAMDFFVFPSRFEGLPGTVIEAQAAGLRCLISDSITREVLVSPLAEMESIDKSPVIWAEYIVKHMEYERKDMVEMVGEAGFDVTKQVMAFESFYLNKDRNIGCLTN